MGIRVSVVVPVFNGAGDVGRLLEALAVQTVGRDAVEYIIVDNNSRDGTRETVIGFVQASCFPVACLEERAVQGSYAARNTGIRGARGDILVFTDADCTPAPDWIERLVARFDRPEIGAVAGGILAASGDSLLEDFAAHVGLLSQDYALRHPFRPFGQTANLAVRRQVFVDVGLFRAGLTTGGDADLCWRMLAGTVYELAYEPTAVVHHRHRSTIAGLREQFVRYGRSVVHLEQLHGWRPPREPRSSYYARKLALWALLRFPGLLLAHRRGRIARVNVYREPLSLYTRWLMRTGARRCRRAPLSADQIAIEFLEPRPAAPS